MSDAYEATFHETNVTRFLLRCRDGEAAKALSDPKLERAIGVIYRPETERQSHYFHARLADQFDAVIHFDETEAVDRSSGRPNGRLARWQPGFEPQARRHSRVQLRDDQCVQPCAGTRALMEDL